MAQFMGESQYNTDRGRTSFLNEFSSILDSNPILFYDSEQGCLTLYRKKEMKKYKISPTKVYKYAFYDGRLSLSHDAWLRIGTPSKVVVAGINDGIQIWNSERWYAEKKACKSLRDLAFGVANVPKPCVIYVKDLEVYSLELWKKILEKNVSESALLNQKERRFLRDWVSGSRIIMNATELIEL